MSRRASAATSCRRSTASPAAARTASGSTGSTTSTASSPPRARASASCYPGDRVWWDHHDWETAMRVPAVVGSFPEPFRSGQDGKKLPIRLVCLAPGGSLVRRGRDAAERCRHAQRRALEPRVLAGRGAADPRRALEPTCARTSSPASSRKGRRSPACSPSRTRPATDRAARRRGRDGAHARPGVRARRGDQLPGVPPTWLITGTDDVGVAASAAALTEDGLRYHFALAIEAGRGVPLPLEGTVTPRSRRSPLHATRAGVGGVWCLALGSVPLVSENPAVLIAVLVVEVARRAGGRARAQLRRAAAGACRSPSRCGDQRARHA